MYLSRLILNLRSYAARRDLSDCQAMHRTVMSGFPEVDSAASRAALGVLYRVERQRQGASLLVQSGASPNWDSLPSGYLSGAINPNPSIKQLDDTYDRAVATGRRFRFRLVANPTVKLAVEGKKNGMRVPIRDDEERLAWLRRKGEQGGFKLLATRVDKAVDDVRARPGQIVRGRRKRGRGDLTFEGVTFDGRLQVTDPAEFLDVLRRGVGSGKAYGFGLLSIASS